MLKRNWNTVDKRAQAAKLEDAQTYTKLIDFLEKPIHDDLDRDIYMTRALIYWLYCNENTNLDNQPSDTPLRLLKDMHDNKIAYAVAFEILCSKARVKCETVFGISKSGNYQPGDKDTSKMTGSWNKVYLEGKWWPIYPRWVLRSLVGASHGDYKQIESEGVAQKPTTPKLSHGHIKSHFTDFWFLTDPEIFIYKCYPDSIEDQMLPKSKQVKRKERFLKLPHLTLHFFEANLQLMSENSCVVETEEGICNVIFKADKIKAKSLTFEYTFFIKKTDNLDAFEKKYDQTRLVLNSRKSGQFMFEIRCPVEGIYKLEIKGGHVDATVRKVYLVSQIVCRERIRNLHPLPIDAGKVGFGFGPFAEDVGLMKPSSKEPKLSIKSKPGKDDAGKNESVSIKFDIDKDVIRDKDYTAELHGLNKTSEELKDFVSSTKDTKKCELRVTASVPDPGEYALMIKSADRQIPGEKQTFEPACNFLLTTLEEAEKLEDEYYDSSDGMSDMDEEICELQTKMQQLRDKRDELTERISLSMRSTKDHA